ncbi:biotin/lipoyl-binding protein, partial [Patescibacteria group bacterium]|nr:biotin/lipoyl-binding protein [Patescibacteria group bacterium]
MKIKKKYFFLVLIIIIIVFLIYFFTKEKEQEYNIISVERGDLIQEVSVIGRVEPAMSVDLAFEKSGRVAKVSVDIGEQVVIGQILIELDNNDLTAQLAQDRAALESAQAGLKQYEAGLDAEKAKLDELKAGAKLEEIQVVETKVSNAEKTLIDAQTNLENVENKADIDLLNLYNGVEDILNDAYFKADDALNKQIDDLFSNDSSVNPTITFSTSDSQAKIDVEQGRV